MYSGQYHVFESDGDGYLTRESGPHDMTEAISIHDKWYMDGAGVVAICSQADWIRRTVKFKRR